VDFRPFLRTEHHLGLPVAVAQIDEHHSAVIAVRIDPAAQLNGFADVGLAEFSAVV